ncbi:EF-hand calcium-binding domain-containing protein 5 [Rhizophlyctis rosea]|uniref:EF-hand calcium-binding domain-containing protein 5 n=1 Tax=Rhizophlyctis rosea TaxID=64517 RepID=A0AAD5SJD0_9FUNG|nr:EF-hand calcium-binding domain-containing protein 5 [Rhizophlyctis rosea]
MAIAALANDFLDVPELSLDVRAYIVETTLPTLVLALEKLLKEEEVYRAVFSSENVQSNPDMLQKVAEILKGIRSAQSTPLPSRAPSTASIPTTPSSTTRPASVRGPAYDKWDQERYVSTHLRLTDQWTMEELTFFLQQLGAVVDQKGDSLKHAFDEAFFIPHFAELAPDASREDWMGKLKEVVGGMEVGEEGVPEGVGLAKDMCLRFCDGTLEEYLGRPPGGLLLTRRSTMSRSMSVTQPTADSTEVKAGAHDAESEYKQFCKSLIGDVGPEGFRALMDHLRSKAGPIRDGKDAEVPAAAENMEFATTGEGAVKERRDSRAADMAVARASMAGSLYDMLARTQSGGAVSVRLINRLLDDALASPEYSDDIKEILKSLKLTEATDVENGGNVTRDDFVKRYVEVWTPLNEDQLSALFPILSFTFGKASAGTEFPHTVGGGEPMPEGEPIPVHEITTHKVIITAERRAEIEQVALSAISALTSEMQLNIAAACRSALDRVAQALGQLHPEHDIRGRISLRETSMTKVTETNADGTVVAVTSEQKFLRHVACTEDLVEGVLGSTVAEGHGLEAEVLAGVKPVFVADVRKHEAATGVDVFAVQDRDKAVDRYLGVPIVTSTGATIGIVQMNMLGDEQNFVDEDAKFIQQSIGLLVKALDDIDSRDKAIILANSAKSWAVEHGDVEVEIYLPHPQTGAHQEIYALVDVSKEEKEKAGSTDLSMSHPESPYMGPASAKLIKINKEEGEGINVWATFQTKESMEVTDEQTGHTTVLLPIVDPTTNACVAVMRVKARGAKKRIPEEDMEEVRRAANVFNHAMEYVHKERFGEGMVMRVLDAENIDENARRHLMFAKMMLLDARLALSRLDSRAMSELRSYKKPPLTVHKIIKAVLYLFGKTPKEVKKWSDVVKFVNQDLLKQMIDYDPTAIQKKIRFKRVKAVLKTIPHGDAKKRGSIPAMYMYDWLCVSVALRDEAVVSRKARSDVFTPEREDTGEKEGGLGEEGEEEEEEIEDDTASLNTAKSEEGVAAFDRAASLQELEDVSKDVPAGAGHGPHSELLGQDEFAPPGDATGNMVVEPVGAETASGNAPSGAIIWDHEGDGPPAAAQPDDGDRDVVVRSGVGAHEVEFAGGDAKGFQDPAGPTNDASPVPITEPPNPEETMSM